jgi:hypothetical protein
MIITTFMQLYTYILAMIITQQSASVKYRVVLTLAYAVLMTPILRYGMIAFDWGRAL